MVDLCPYCGIDIDAACRDGAYEGTQPKGYGVCYDCGLIWDEKGVWEHVWEKKTNGQWREWRLLPEGIFLVKEEQPCEV